MNDSPRGRLDGWPAPLRIPLRLLAALARGLARGLRRAVWRLAPSRIASSWRFAATLLRGIRQRRSAGGLTVAVDVNALWEPLTGVGWYLYQLLGELADRTDLKLRLYGPDLVGDGGESQPTVALPVGEAIEAVRYTVPHDLALPPGVVVRCLRLLQPLLLAADGNRVLFAPNFFLPRRFATARGALVATVHDLAFKRVAWTVREETRSDLEQHLEQTLRRATRVITPSRAVRDELVEEGMVEAERVVAVHHGPGHLEEPLGRGTRAPVAAPFGLHVGTLEPRKNLALLLAAWRIARQRSDKVPVLVLCGGYGWKSEELRQAVEAATSEGWVVHLGYVDDSTLAALYAEARLAASPSLYEGFGLPVVEAMKASVPVLCSDIPVFREVARDGARFVPPRAQEAWSEAIVELCEDDTARSRLRLAGKAVADSLAWSKAAAGTVDVLRAADATVGR